MTGKGKVPLVGVKPDASHLPDEHPRLVDHTDFPVLQWALKNHLDE